LITPGGLITFDLVPELPWEWRFPGIIPSHTPVLFIAEGGTGKGMLFAAVIARETTGDPYPGQLPSDRRDPGTVLLISPEDDPNRTQVGRLTAAGADLRYVVSLSYWPDGKPVEFPTDIPRLAKLIRDIADPENETYAHLPAVSMVVVDPLTKLLSPGYSIGTRPAAVRAIKPLVEMCGALPVAMIIAHHTNKDGKANGSLAVLDSVRGAFMITRGDDPDTRVVTQRKSNGDFAGGFTYRITGPKGRGHAVFPEPGEASGVRLEAARDRTLGAAQRALEPAVPHRVARLVMRPNGDGTPVEPEREIIGKAGSLSDGKRLAREDVYADGRKLLWREQDGSHIALCNCPGGITAGYSVYPVATEALSA
jgi:hypothetical protein